MVNEQSEKKLEQSEAVESSEQSSSHASDALKVKRGRLIAAGVVTTVLLSVLALVVVGIFQITMRWLTICPTDLPVNDPAPVLWQKVVQEQPFTAQTGVPENVKTQAGFKRESSQ
jgi:hypothetical protein